MAGNRLQELGLTAVEADGLAVELSKRLNILDAAAIDELLERYTCISTALSAADWCRCFRHTPDLLSAAPESFAAGLSWLQELFHDDTSSLVDTLLGCPELMQQDRQDLEAKVQLLQKHNGTGVEAQVSTRQTIIRLATRAPSLLCQPLADLQVKIQCMAAVLSISRHHVAEMMYEVPSIADLLADVTEEASETDPNRTASLLQQQLGLLEEVLSLDGDAMRVLVLHQPILLTKSMQELQHVVKVLEELLSHGKLAEVATAAPQLLSLETNMLKAHFNLLHQLAQLQPSWQNELTGASAQTQAVWLTASEQQLRRLEVAAADEQLSQLSMHELLSLSDGDWLEKASAAGVGVADSTADIPAAASNHSHDAYDVEQHSQEPNHTSGGTGQVTDSAPVELSSEEAAPSQNSHNSLDDSSDRLAQPSNTEPTDTEALTVDATQQDKCGSADQSAVCSDTHSETCVSAQLPEADGSAVKGVAKEAAGETETSTADRASTAGPDAAANAAADAVGGRHGAGAGGGGGGAAAEEDSGTVSGLVVHEAALHQESASREETSFDADRLDSPGTPDGDSPPPQAATAPADEPAAAAAAAVGGHTLRPPSPAAAATGAKAEETVVTPEPDLPASAAAVPPAAAEAPAGESAAAREECPGSPPSAATATPSAAVTAPVSDYGKVASRSAAESGATQAGDSEQPSTPAPGADPAGAVISPELDPQASSAAVPPAAAEAPAGESAAAGEVHSGSARSAAAAAAPVTGDSRVASMSAAEPSPTPTGDFLSSRLAHATADVAAAAAAQATAQPGSPNRDSDSSNSTITSTTPAKATSGDRSSSTAMALKSPPASSVSHSEMERREAFMSKLLAQVPTYAVTLLGTDQADKLHFLSHMAPADLSAVLAQPKAEELLEAVYAVHLKKQQQQQQQQQEVSTSMGTAAPANRKAPADTSSNGEANDTTAGVNATKASASASKPKGSTPAATTLSTSAEGKAAADTQQQSAVITDRGRRYAFVDGAVCNVCGSKGHLGADCRTSRCSTCQRIGHPPGKCNEACRVCGKRHKPGPCTMPYCDYCKLYGHGFEHCPTAHCKKCDCYGHVPSLCPGPKPQQTAAGSSSGSSNSKSAPAAAFVAAAAALKPAASANGDDSSSRPAAAAAAATAALKPAAATAAKPQAPAARTMAPPTAGNKAGHEAAAPKAAPVAPPLPSRPVPQAQEPAAATAVQPVTRQATINSSNYAATAPVARTPAAPGPAAISSLGKGILVEDGGKSYLFTKSVVCPRCGKPGHLGSLCETHWCGRCRVFGHRYGECEAACYTCGRKHAFTINGGRPVCYTSHCNLCNKFSHSADECPAARCSGCGYYGHTRSGCPAPQQQQQAQQLQQPVSEHQPGIRASGGSMQYSAVPLQASGPSPTYHSSSSAISSSYSMTGAAAPPSSRARSSLQLEKPVSSSSSRPISRPAAAEAIGAAPGPAAAAQRSTPTPNSSSSKWITLVDSGTHYKCHQYPACTTCGTVGHLSGSCKTPFCSSCGKFGHLTHRCHSACQTCGKQHDPGEEGCYMPLCPTCMLYGHIGKHCPSAQCKTCGYFGHVARICPDQYLVGQPAGGSAGAMAEPAGSSSRQRIDSSWVEPSRSQTLDISSRAEQTVRAAVYGSSSRGLSQHDGWGESAAVASSSSRSSRPPQSDAWEDTAPAARSSSIIRSRPSVPIIQGKQYRFVGAPVCGRCGRTGHIGAECHADFCKACQKWGHETGLCSNYCRKCGKNHARGGCTMALCSHCQLWGHAAKQCPTVQCSSCRYWGHSTHVCPNGTQPGLSRSAQGSGSAAAQVQGHSSSRAAQGNSPAAAAAAAARAIAGRDSGWPSDVNTAEDSWPDTHRGDTTSGNSGSGCDSGAVSRSTAASAPSGSSRRGGPTAQFVLEPPAASEEEDKARGAKLVHTLFASLPEYASTLMGDKLKLSCLARLTPADLQYILAQKHPEHLLDGVCQAQQQKRKQAAQMHQQAQQLQEHRSVLSQAAAERQSNTRSGGPTLVSMQQASRAAGPVHQPRAIAQDAGIADSSSILMQQMAATLAGFKQMSVKQHNSESPMAGARLMAGEGVFGLKRGFSEDDDMSDMLGLLGVQHP